MNLRTFATFALLLQAVVPRAGRCDEMTIDALRAIQSARLASLDAIRVSWSETIRQPRDRRMGPLPDRVDAPPRDLVLSAGGTYLVVGDSLETHRRFQAYNVTHEVVRSGFERIFRIHDGTVLDLHRSPLDPQGADPHAERAGATHSVLLTDEVASSRAEFLHQGPGMIVDLFYRTDEILADPAFEILERTVIGDRRRIVAGIPESDEGVLSGVRIVFDEEYGYCPVACEQGGRIRIRAILNLVADPEIRLAGGSRTATKEGAIIEHADVVVDRIETNPQVDAERFSLDLPAGASVRDHRRGSREASR